MPSDYERGHPNGFPPSSSLQIRPPPVRGRLCEDGHHMAETRQRHFPPVSTPRQLFAGILLVRHCRRPFWLCRRVEAKASTGPQLSIPVLDILVSILPGNPHHAAKMPEEATRACPSPDAHCTCWTVQLSPDLLGSGNNNNAIKKLD